MSDLLKLSLFGVDLGQWLAPLAGKKSVLLMGAVVVAASIVAMVLFKSNTDQLARYRHQIQQAHSKINLINQYKTSTQELQQWTPVSSQPPLPSEMFVNQLIDYATQNHIDVTNFLPKPTENKNFYDTASVSLSVHANNFKNLIAFMHTVEVSPYFFRIESWAGESHGSDTVDCKMDINYIQVKI